MSIIFVTGTGTDVGKTIATAALALRITADGHRVIPVKPVQTGVKDGDTDDGDIATVEKLTGLGGVEFHRYPDPLAPNLAARRAGRPAPDLEELAEQIRELDAPDTVVLVEGAGGLLVHLTDSETCADLARELDAEVVVVTTLGLGSLNSAALTVEATRARGLKVLGLIGGSLPDDQDLATSLNLSELPVVTGVPLWGTLPAGLGQDAAFAETAHRYLPAGCWTGEKN
ncbi:ATP-dependent dethiobiotin synthetase BioD [Corynebacterium atrinae]|uniref:dethiobiotin synthase n=1 Tax=Corynebacterium atrinae TaxID=1336740 RepID=UPI0025B5D64F|nr:dethiobiotin synthase [Corynebacterium atrinae]WJY63310.1 ATP-dependent dethiobiotin synthetase BioD [Corynebacterium atrinae]